MLDDNETILNSHTINGHLYTISVTNYVRNFHNEISSFPNKPLNMHDITFWRDNDLSRTLTHDTTNPIKVLTTIAKDIDMHIKSNPSIECLGFGASSKESKRYNLYDKYMKRLAKQHHAKMLSKEFIHSGKVWFLLF